MEIWVFVLLAGVWAAFAWSSFFDSRRSAPAASTKSFARSTALLASVSTSGQRATLARQRAAARRQRILLGLGAGAVLALGVSIWFDSVAWLGLAIAFDLALAAYIGLLLHIKQQRHLGGQVVPMPISEAPAATEPAPSSVRVVAG